MRCRKPEFKILEELFKQPQTTQELSSALNIDSTEIEKICSNLEDLKVIEKFVLHWNIDCRTKKLTLNRTNATIEEIIEFAKKKLSYQKLENSYTTYEGEQGNSSHWEETALLMLNKPSELKKHLNLFNFDNVPTLQELVNRFRKLIKRYHSDKGGNNETAVQLNLSYKWLKNHIKS